MQIKFAAITVFMALSISCGANDAKKEATDAATAEDTDNDGSLFELKGSITTAFDVTVDDADYPDLETFYTEEVGRLPEKVAKQGYEGYSVKFDAQIGFTDLYSGMKLFAQSTSGRGYQAQGSTRGDGNFIINMPADAAGDTYKVRGVKRISIILTKGEETKKFCYNFGPQDTNVPYGDRDKPIIMNAFTTRITAYECAQDSTSGVTIPANTATVSKSTGDISTGLLGTFTSESGEEFVGMTADNAAIYILLSNGKIKQVSNGQLVDKCTLSASGTGLAWDGTYFYTITNHDRSVFGKFNADCTLADTIDTGLSSMDNGADISVRGGKLYWTRYGGSYDTNKLMVLDLNSKAFKSFGDVTSSTEKTYFYLPDNVKGIGADDNDYVWSVFDKKDFSGLPSVFLWKYDVSGQNQYKFTALPTKDFTDLKSVSFLAVQDNQNILLGSIVGSNKFAIYAVNGAGM